MSNLPRAWADEDYAIWIRGKAELRECQQFLNRISIQLMGEGMDIELLQRFNEEEELMRDPEYNDLIFDAGKYYLPRNFIRLIPVIRWPLVRDCLKEMF